MPPAIIVLQNMAINKTALLVPLWFSFTDGGKPKDLLIFYLESREREHGRGILENDYSQHIIALLSFVTYFTQFSAKIPVHKTCFPTTLCLEEEKEKNKVSQLVRFLLNAYLFVPLSLIHWDTGRAPLATLRTSISVVSDPSRKLQILNLVPGYLSKEKYKFSSYGLL